MSIAKVVTKAGKAAKGIRDEFKSNVKDGMSRASKSISNAAKAVGKGVKDTAKGVYDGIKEGYQSGSGKGASAVTRKAMSRMSLKTKK